MQNSPPIDVLPGTGDDGQDAATDLIARFMAAVRDRQDAVWAVLNQGRVVVRAETDRWPPRDDDVVTSCRIYLPRRWYEWWLDEANRAVCWRTVEEAALAVWRFEGPIDLLFNIEPILDVPNELVDFVAQNIARPKPRRYNSTAVQYFERDGVAWLTAPEAKLYDALKETGWLFIPQPQFLASELIDSRPDFLIFWKNRAQNAVLVEVDSDRFHSAPSQRESDEAKERRFASRGFDYLRFSAKRVLDDPFDVVKEITEYCTRKFGR